MRGFSFDDDLGGANLRRVDQRLIQGQSVETFLHTLFVHKSEDFERQVGSVRSLG